MFLTWLSICRLTATLIIIFLVRLKSVLICQGGFWEHFYTRDCITMLTLFKSIVLSRLDYGSQLWSPFLIKHITQLEKIQRSFIKHITGMNDMPYHSTHFREEEKGTALSIYGKLLRAWLLIFRTQLQVHFLDVEAGHASFPMSM